MFRSLIILLLLIPTILQAEFLEVVEKNPGYLPTVRFVNQNQVVTRTSENGKWIVRTIGASTQKLLGFEKNDELHDIIADQLLFSKSSFDEDSDKWTDRVALYNLTNDIVTTFESFEGSENPYYNNIAFSESQHIFVLTDSYLRKYNFSGQLVREISHDNEEAVIYSNINKNDAFICGKNCYFNGDEFTELNPKVKIRTKAYLKGKVVHTVVNRNKGVRLISYNVNTGKRLKRKINKKIFDKYLRSHKLRDNKFLSLSKKTLRKNIISAKLLRFSEDFDCLIQNKHNINGIDVYDVLGDKIILRYADDDTQSHGYAILRINNIRKLAINHYCPQVEVSEDCSFSASDIHEQCDVSIQVNDPKGNPLQSTGIVKSCDGTNPFNGTTSLFQTDKNGKAVITVNGVDFCGSNIIRSPYDHPLYRSVIVWERYNRYV